MSRKRRKNKNRRKSDSEESEQLPFVCRCHRKSFNQKIDLDSKDSEKKQANDISHLCSSPNEAQTQCQSSEGNRQEREHDVQHRSVESKITSSPSTYDKTDNFVKVILHDTSAMPQSDNDLHYDTEQAENGGDLTAQVTSDCLHLNLAINQGVAPYSKTHVEITSGNCIKKSRSYHDRQHQQSEHNADHKWDFVGDSRKGTVISAPKNQSCDKPLIKIEIIGEGIKVKYKTGSQNLMVHIEADKIQKKTDDIFGSGFTQTNDYRSTGGSCSSYPVSDFSCSERKEFCAKYRCPEWCVDVPPPPAEFADEKGVFTNTNTEDEALLLEDSIKEPYYTSPISSWSEPETEPRQLKDEACPAENDAKLRENHYLQYLRSWKQCTNEPKRPNKDGFSQDPFISYQEIKVDPPKCCHLSDCPFDAKVVRRKTFPEMYYDPLANFSPVRQTFCDMGEQPLLCTSNSMAQRNQTHVPSVELGQQQSSASFTDCASTCKEKVGNNHIPSELKKTISYLTRVDSISSHSGVPSPCQNSNMSSIYSPQELYVKSKQMDNDEDLEDILKDAEERIELTESGFDEDMLDSDNHTEVYDVSELQKSFLIQVTPSSQNTSRNYFLRKNSSSRVPAECLQQTFQSDLQAKEISQLNASEMECTTRKRRGSVVTVVTGDLDQRVLIQGETDSVASRLQREPLKEFKSSMVSRDSVLTPVFDVEEPDVENKMLSSFEAHSPLVCKDISSQTSEAFDPFLSLEDQRNMPDDTHMKETNEDVCPEPVESNNTSPRNSSDSAVPGTSFESLTCQIPNLPKSDVQDNSPEDVEKVAEYSEKIETTKEKMNPRDANSETFNKHLKLPKDFIINEPGGCESPQEEGSDRWAKKRKQFKETKNCNSAGGSSIATLTEESVNSEENRSVDFGARTENKDKGLYTESFHSASWIFRGDDCSPDNSPRCLSKRPRSVAIRERTVRIAKGTGDYPWGFRIQFSKPILVTEVDTNGAAEEAGLQVGDIVMAVNGTDVTSIPHSEAASLARQGPDVLTLVVGSDISRFPNTPRPTCRGYLHKRTHSGLLKGWRKRWFVLKHDGSLHYYKHKKDEGKCQPLEVTKLEGSEIGVDTTLGKPFVFRCVPQTGSRIYYFCATSNQEMKRWLEAMDKAVHPLNQNHVWVDVTIHNISLPPLAIKNPECLGLLHQLDRNKDFWIQHYCILKDGCLYFYSSIRSNSALGGIYLQGYTVGEQSLNSRRCIIELRPPSEEFKAFYLSAGNAAENKRWITALKISINKWLPLHQAIQDFMSRPLEETRM
ncbi:uncharacterized protein LOC142098622 isoform X2 [Mixophyes fleayi]|uniref:uncharacterized protein LOC142098622 isoform X2 n=1 Tax=Mixophyes fleayi TaxID=3061075 RepID=UPI003F4E0B18